MVDADERWVVAGKLRIWTERLGDPRLPAVLMIMGSGAQGVFCPDALVGRLLERGVQVIRFDHRDTGRSSVVDFDAEPYTLADMAGDCLAVLDGYGLDSAHVAGASLGGMIAQWLAVHSPDRVRSLTVMSSSPMGHDARPAWARAQAGEPADPDDLPPPAPEFFASPKSDLALFRFYNGTVRTFDEPAARATLELARSRATDPAAAANHDRAAWTDIPGLHVPLSSITAPTSIVHGDRDPVFPLAHGEALAAAIPGAVLHVVPDMGHAMTSLGLPEELADLIRL
ncbi:pimeloyl-ACP methyl ester carboxylesterase [Actinoplanes tereljensis]|uniref:Hydrolase n=1 Tax=Paractinoplanes tereljensis TaxID=571912 RepID=A0A919NNZ3_9ACTN|nr:alpha/beta fold hydrolase [Actinoplanes tereljensis]GIF22013.1 hydrolase [Actinoplanes tereljensis]